MKTLLQIAFLLGFYGLGEMVVRLAHIPLPGSVAGLALILGAMQAGWIKAHHLRDGAHALLGRMLLFFVPAVPAVIEHREFVAMLGVKLLAVVLCGTLLVMATTGAVVQWVVARGGRDD